MPRLVSGVFYERSEAERAVEALKRLGIPPENIYLEAEMTPPMNGRRTDHAVSSVEKERRFAGLETGLIIGPIVGFLAGMGIGTLCDAMSVLMRNASGDTIQISPLFANPFVTAAIGLFVGLLVGGIIGWMIDYTLTLLGAGPPLPTHETLVTVRAEEYDMDHVCEVFSGSHVRHLHAEGSRAYATTA